MRMRTAFALTLVVLGTFAAKRPLRAAEPSADDVDIAQGKTVFAHVEDPSGRIQVYFRQDALGRGAGDAAAETLLAARLVDQEGIKKTANYVTMSMVSNLAVKQADKYLPLILQFAQQYRVSPSLIFAIIRTESNFNPYAVSPAPAYGLMQLVPTSRGREAYRRAKGKDVDPSRDYLFDPANNVELGTAYWNVLMFDQLDDVQHEVSREYCVIAAYNTGPSNVFRKLSQDRVAAINQINGLQPAGVYDQLRQSLPYEETRRYLEKVSAYRKSFVNSTENSN